MKRGIVLTPRLSPRIYSIFHKACVAFGIETEVEVICIRQPEVNAFAVVEPRGPKTYSYIGISSAALEMLDDLEIQALLGHEISHFLFDNHRLNALIRRGGGEGQVTILPPMGESLFLRWRKKAELSADRAALIASNSLEASARCLIKASFGLSDRNLDLDIPSLLQQIQKMKGSRETMDSEFSSHPLLPVRLAALEIFSRSEKAKQHGYVSSHKELLGDEELEAQVDELVAITQRHPHTQRKKSMMNLVAAGGAAVLGADKVIGDTEVKTLIQILHEHFTDQPEKVVDQVCCDLHGIIDEWLPVLHQHGSIDDKKFVLSRITDVAISDGALVDTEAEFLINLAAKLDLPQKTAYAIMVGSAQDTGFRRDAKLSEMADRLRRQLSFGMLRHREEDLAQ